MTLTAQAYAASVLRNTSGLVRFRIGRESDPHNSEVAHLIRQSVAADRERDERRRAMEAQLSRHFLGDAEAAGHAPPPPPAPEAAPTPTATSADAAAAAAAATIAALSAQEENVQALQQKLHEVRNLSLAQVLIIWMYPGTYSTRLQESFMTLQFKRFSPGFPSHGLVVSNPI